MVTRHRCFSITISALDLATTPFSLERAQRQKQDPTWDTPLTSFLENYRTYRCPRFPFLPLFRPLYHGLKNYEIRTLKPSIRAASQSQSTLIRIFQDGCKLDGSLTRRRVVPVEVLNYNFFWKTFWKIYGSTVLNRHRSLEALDLAARGSVAVFKFDQDYYKLWATFPLRSSRLKLNCRRWRFRLWRRRVLVTVPLLILAVIFLFFLVVAFVWSPPFIHLTTLDRRLCGDVKPGPYPCTITANPDVAGIGVSLCWMQSTLH